jgi:hypothetical protein
LLLVLVQLGLGYGSFPLELLNGVIRVDLKVAESASLNQGTLIHYGLLLYVSLPSVPRPDPLLIWLIVLF